MAILYTPEKDIIKEYISVFSSVFEKNGIKVSIINAGNALITDIISSNIVIFGAEDETEKKTQSDFKEIIRALKGVNLAGRFCGFISFNKKSTSLVFKKALSDTGIGIFKDELILDSVKINKKFVKSWALELLKDFKANLHE
jgi:flavodoxin